MFEYGPSMFRLGTPGQPAEAHWMPTMSWMFRRLSLKSPIRHSPMAMVLDEPSWMSRIPRDGPPTLNRPLGVLTGQPSHMMVEPALEK